MSGKKNDRQGALSPSHIKGAPDGAARLEKFLIGEINILPCSGDREREFIIAELDAMQAEIDRQHAILRAAGLDGAYGEAMLPVRQKVGGLF